jgi:predicted ATPase with chaperone activity
LESHGNIIRLYDPRFHQLIEPETEERGLGKPKLAYDRRWANCRRPFIVTGGELSVSMLDLSYNPVSKIYNAPYQLKANNGTYLIDDFGRQKAAPAEILNGWILPMEDQIDYLSFLDGVRWACHSRRS